LFKRNPEYQFNQVQIERPPENDEQSVVEQVEQTVPHTFDLFAITIGSIEDQEFGAITCEQEYGVLNVLKELVHARALDARSLVALDQNESERKTHEIALEEKWHKLGFSVLALDRFSFSAPEDREHARQMAYSIRVPYHYLKGTNTLFFNAEELGVVHNECSVQFEIESAC